MAKEKSMSNSNLPKEGTGEKPLKVRIGRVESVDLYQVKDNELDTFENGSPASLQLVFSTFLLSIAIAFLISLLTATFSSDTVKTVFLIVTIVGFILGIYFMIASWKNRASIRRLCKKIRERIPQDSIIIDEPDMATMPKEK